MAEGATIRTRVSVLPLLGVVLALYLLPLQWVIAWYFAVLLHELGHLLALKLSGGKVYDIQISAKGCRMSSSQLTDRQALFCIAAGPLAGLLPLLIARQIPRIAVCALVQSVFNLIPIYPLDGGKILRLVRNGLRRQKLLAMGSAWE